MNIQWNKVTWYSKLAALFIFGGTLLLGFYLGIEYQKIRAFSNSPPLAEVERGPVSPKVGESGEEDKKNIDILIENQTKQWMVSLYRSDTTIMRLDYSSKEACLSAGRSYLSDKSAERFDCGYECPSFNKINLQDSPTCKEICNEAGCR